MVQPNANNTLVCTVGAWSDYDEKAFVFRRSAGKNGIPIHVVGHGRPWIGFFHNKIIDVRDMLRKVDRVRYPFVLYADARDSVFTADLESIVERYCELAEPDKVLFSSDLPGRSYPFDEHWFIESIEARYGIGGVLNSGGYMGAVSDVLRLLDDVVRLHECILNRPSSLPKQASRAFRQVGRAFAWDDQFLLQCLQADGNDLIHVDRDKDLFGLWIEGFPDLAKRNDHVVNPARDIGRALILHSPHRFRDEPDACRAWAESQGLIHEESLSHAGRRRS